MILEGRLIRRAAWAALPLGFGACQYSVILPGCQLKAKRGSSPDPAWWPWAGNLAQRWSSWEPDRLSQGRRPADEPSTAAFRVLQTSRTCPWLEGGVDSTILIVRTSSGKC